MTKTSSLSPKTVWGKVVLFLKEHRRVALHVACGDITEVAIEGNNLIVKVYDTMLADLLSEGRRDIENALSWQGLEMNFKYEVVQKIVPPQEEDIEKLKKLVGKYLIIKE